MFDPLSAFMISTGERRGLSPIPLLSTNYEIEISSGLAVVTCHRLFKNVEDTPIEAMMTFPVPVGATLFSLVADIDGRKLKAKCQPRSNARETYENAIDGGRSAVLHEELLRGIHMLSVGNIVPNASVRVTTIWTATLSVLGDEASLRIPQTVGQVYGSSGLPETDELTIGGVEQPVMVSVKADTPFRIEGAVVESNHARITNAQPIDIIAAAWLPNAIVGRASDGRTVRLELSPLKGGDQSLSVAMLVDHSGSMGTQTAARSALSCHEAVRQGLHRLASQIQDTDLIDLWEFSSTVRRVGMVGPVDTPVRASADASPPRTTLQELAKKLTAPMGGTEIGDALNATLAGSCARDILVLTDGQSYSLDPDALARSGRRISVILIGSDSLEARIGYVAALTGGDVFVATETTLASVMDAAIQSLRRAHAPPPYGAEVPAELLCTHNNVGISAQWSSAPATSSIGLLGEAAVAYATSLLFACLPGELATELAVSEGLVTHRTSLVLVDEEGELAVSLPVARKVALASPRTFRSVDFAVPVLDHRVSRMPDAMRSTFGFPEHSVRAFLDPQDPQEPILALDAPDDLAQRLNILLNSVAQKSARSAEERLHEIASELDWGSAPGELLAGKLDCLTEATRATVIELSNLDAVKALAGTLNVLPSALILALLAHMVASTNRLAARFARAVLSKTSREDVDKVRDAVLDWMTATEASASPLP